ncbi:DNA-binding protein D-ETS-4 [Folsomia candida]|uniref:DNA-binding protein D-ETS-4 n=1 Tax=Folsomia candida TaxID=158441 RepID=A0A226E8I8_FOLCA|nr:DNA-binding protein D-ETS-4 [Folsomia candida]
MYELLVVFQVEEQMVPSGGGFSPQPDNSNGPSFGNYSNYDTSSSSVTPFDVCTYGNLADTFDLSLLGDSYDDGDMATVPSPMALGLEASWTSFYAPSPSSELRAFSPDCLKPSFSSNRDQMTPAAASNNPMLPSGIMCSSNNNNGISTLSPSNDVGQNERNALLRHYLEDTTFQSKFLPTITVNDDDLDAIMKSNSAADLQSGNRSMELDPVFSLAYEQMRSDVQHTCNTLSISQDPTQWSVADVQSWLVYSLRSMESSPTSESSVCAALRNFWNMDGRTLCSLSEEEFRLRDSVNGDKLFASLELWKILQWNGNNASNNNMVMNHNMLHSPRHEFDLTSIVGVTGRGSHHQHHLSGGSSPASVCPDMMDDIKLFPEKTVSHENYLPSNASNPSSVGTVSKHSDDDDSEEDEEKSATAMTGNNSKTALKLRPHGSKSGAHIHLWQFLKELLLESGQQHGSCIRWLDQSRGVFKIEDSVRVARLWGLRKNRPAMNYDKLSRSIRQYYRKGIMRKTERSQRLVYQFCHPYGC